MSDCCSICGIECNKWNDIFILFKNKIYCAECYEHMTGKEIKLICLN